MATKENQINMRLDNETNQLLGIATEQINKAMAEAIAKQNKETGLDIEPTVYTPVITAKALLKKALKPYEQFIPSINDFND